jgi:Kef-type K+ transport system membrane component KefB
MSDTATNPKTASVRLVQAAALVVVLGVLLLVTRVAPEARSVVGTMAGLGVLLLAGTLTSELAEMVRLPHLTGYLLAGAIAGPHVLNLVDHATVDRLQSVNGLALSLIALAGGAELRLEILRNVAKSLAWSTLFQSSIVFVACGGAFLLLARFTPFASLGSTALLATAILWATVSVSRSPAALLGILAQVKPKGPLTSYSVAFVMFSDVVVIAMMAVAVAFVRPVLDPTAELSLANLGLLGHEILGSVALGVTLGLALSGYLRLVGKNLLLVLVLLGVGLSELLRYIQLDAMLGFLVAGFVVENFSDQGRKLLRAIENTGAIVFVIFFAVAGAHLDIPVLEQLGPVALALCVVRGAFTWLSARLSSRVAGDVPVIRTWGWSSMISQAGLTLGLSVIVTRTFPAIQESFRALAVAVVAINEVVGPILFKWALDRSGESSRAVETDSSVPSSAR